MSWVTHNLAVGGRVRPEDIRALARAGITHVIDTRSEYADDQKAMAREHIELLHLPTADTQPLTIEQMIEGARWAHEHIQRGDRVLIHCEHGVGRSVLLTCATLVYEGMHAQEALELVQEKRWQASPNHKQVTRLREFESLVSAQRRGLNRLCRSIFGIARCNCVRYRFYSGWCLPHRHAPAHSLQHRDIVIV